MSKLTKVDKDKLFAIATRLQLTTDWPRNRELISELYTENAPDLEMATYWTQTSDFTFLTPQAESIFGDYLKSIKRGDIVQSEHLQHNLELVRAIEDVAHTHRCPPAQIALAWLLAKGKDIVPIPGTKRQTYLEENAAAADVALSAIDVARLDERFSPQAVSGDRSWPLMKKWLDQG